MWVWLVAGLEIGVALSACDGPDPAAEGDPHGDRADPPFPLEGLVVSPRGTALSGAQVELVSWTPEGSPRVVERVRTGHDGAFLFERVDVSRAHHALVVEHAGARRTYVPNLPAEAFREIQRGGAAARAGVRDLRIRLAPVHPLPVRLRCTEPPRDAARLTGDPAEGAGLAPRLTVFWGPGTEDVWWSRSMGASQPADAILPHWELVRRAYPGSTREFAVSLPLPAGQHTLWFDGGCGIDVVDVRVPDGGERMPALEVQLPHPRSGALEVRLPARPCASPPCGRGSEHTTLARGSVELGQYAVRPGATTRVDRLPPGSYRLGPARCERSVEIRDGETTEVSIGPDECEIVSVPPL